MTAPKITVRAPRFSQGSGAYTTADTLHITLDGAELKAWEHPEAFAEVARLVNRNEATPAALHAILDPIARANDAAKERYFTTTLHENGSREDRIFELFGSLQDVVGLLDCELQGYEDWANVSAAFHDASGALVAYMRSCEEPGNLVLV